MKQDGTCPICQNQVQFDKGHPNLLADQAVMLLFEIGVIVGEERKEFKERRLKLHPDQPPLKSPSPIKRTGTFSSSNSQASITRRNSSQPSSTSLRLPQEVLLVDEDSEVSMLSAPRRNATDQEVSFFLIFVPVSFSLTVHCSSHQVIEIF